MKQIIKLTEAELTQIISKAVKKTLNENIFNTPQMGGILSNHQSEDQAAVKLIKTLIKNGTPEEDAIKQIANKYNYRLEYLIKAYNLWNDSV